MVPSPLQAAIWAEAVLNGPEVVRNRTSGPGQTTLLSLKRGKAVGTAPSAPSPPPEPRGPVSRLPAPL